MILSKFDILRFLILLAISVVLYFYSLPEYGYWLLAGACMSLVLKFVAYKLKLSKSANG